MIPEPSRIDDDLPMFQDEPYEPGHDGNPFATDDGWEGDEIPICEYCHGTGQDWDLTPCGECDGEGYQYWLQEIRC